MPEEPLSEAAHQTASPEHDSYRKAYRRGFRDAMKLMKDHRNSKNDSVKESNVSAQAESSLVAKLMKGKK